jgi:hypothetical protein
MHIIYPKVANLSQKLPHVLIGHLRIFPCELGEVRNTKPPRVGHIIKKTPDKAFG